MDPALANLGWTEEQWNRIGATVTEEAQKARVGAQLLPVTGPEDPSTEAVPFFTLTAPPQPPSQPGPPPHRLVVDSDPTLFLTTIGVNLHIRSPQAADPDLKAALVMFRRAANYIARIEDALIFNGRGGPDLPPAMGLGGVPDVYTVTGHGRTPGIFRSHGQPNHRITVSVLAAIPPPPVPPPPTLGQLLVAAIVRAISRLERRGQLAPFACVLGDDYFEAICDPSANLVLPRDRILPFLQGPLLRSSAIPRRRGAVIALSGSPVEIVVACDISPSYLQTTLEPRIVCRVSERVALRIKESRAIAILRD